MEEIPQKMNNLPEFKTNGGEEKLSANLPQVRLDGFAINDPTLFKRWIRAIAIPVFSSEDVVRSINVVVESEEVSVEELRTAYGPVLLKVAEELSAALGYRVSGSLT